MSILNVNQIQPVGSGQTITISASDITASSATITASSVTATTVTSSSTSTFSSGLNVTGGSVGIGTDNPTFLLQVQGDYESLARFRRDNTGSSQGGIIVGNQSRAIKITGGNDGLIITDNTLSRERLRINSSGNIGIGTDSPQYKLDLYGNPGTDAGALLRLKSSINDDNGIIHEQANGQKWFTGQETSNPNDYEFWNYNGSTWNNILNLDGSGDVTVTDGNLVIGTSGHGISFAATSDASGSTSELLDDYEEGTWTPAMGSGGWTLSTVHYARYTKIGNTVRAQAYISLTGSANSDQFYLNGLPYTPPVDAYSVGVADFAKPGKYGIYCRTTPGSTRIEYYYSQANTTLNRGALAGTDLGAGYHIMTLVYNI